jgi:hypothetical protein
VIFFLLAGIASAVGCGGAAKEPAADALAAPPDTARSYEIPELPPEKLTLTGAASLDDLVRTVERGLAEQDTTRLLDLMINEREYREIIYPALPAAHPPINAPFETLWVTHYPDAYGGLMRILRLYGGHDVEILAVRFEAPDQDFVNFTLHENSRVDIVVDGRREDDRRLFGSVIHAGGGWKVLSYPDEE